MPRRSRRSARKKTAQTKSDLQASVQANPNGGSVASPEAISGPAKIGPGQVFVQELVDAKSGHAKRFRNVGSEPLAYAFYRGWLRGAHDTANGITAEDRHSAGQRFAHLWEARNRTGMYAFDRGSGGSGDPHWWTDQIADASEAVSRIRAAMYAKNYLIVQRFCGEGYSPKDAVCGVVEVYPSSVMARMREAMDDLVTVMTGRRN